ncbi:MAG TPA: glutamate synthase subunit beta [Acidimicrobiales bacterium]|nr:glutamate synthase [Actinomycetota bacterium]MDP6062113.1 glutamate synthase subunit beta [Acidimicrobiales bacterium]MDP7209747.1 glutamate synthase subunit beta [Acidimicrobiales bacterium]HJL88823.1 glutamate synthase subunit beta [Acidimicrobiales bacterium]HJO98520.1 glutamate synthase subunit beta [Acidimicrobiales bacterium]
MGDIRGFIKHDRQLPERRSVPVRLRDWREVYEPFPEADLRRQASRCMDCGIPFCNHGCPLGNLIPDWNDLTYRGQWSEASERLHSTNNFPEFTGRLCPAPCETACVLGINEPAVTIKQVEVSIVDRAWEEGWIRPVPASRRSGRRVAVVGSGPAGLAAAQQLTRAGHEVVVFERADRIGGLLRFGIPEFKLEKRHLDRRLAQMEAEGTEFRTRTNVGSDLALQELREDYDAVVLACGATRSRDLPIPGRNLDGIMQAMEFLPWANRIQEGDLDRSPVSAKGRHVVIIGGGDTGADCLGTALRQGAASVHQFEIMPRPADERPEANPWPTWPALYRVSSAHEEGGQRRFAINTEEFLGENGHVTSLRTHGVTVGSIDGRPSFEMIDGSEEIFSADLVLLAMGFTGPETDELANGVDIALDQRGNVARDSSFTTSADGVFVCGDMGRGQSLIVWAIAEGRSCAAAVDEFLVGETSLPAPIVPDSMPLR